MSRKKDKDEQKVSTSQQPPPFLHLTGTTTTSTHPEHPTTLLDRLQERFAIIRTKSSFNNSILSFYAQRPTPLACKPIGQPHHKPTFVLERDVRYLDSRIALLIQNRVALEEVGNSASTSRYGLTG